METIKCINDICLRSRNVLANLRKKHGDNILKIINKMDNKRSADYEMFSNKIIKLLKMKLVNH